MLRRVGSSVSLKNLAHAVTGTHMKATAVNNTLMRNFCGGVTEHWQRLFKKFSSNGTSMTRNEMSKMLEAIEFQGQETQIQQVFDELNSNQSNTLEINDFTKIMKTLGAVQAN